MVDRRTKLALGLALLTAGLAGCIGDAGGDLDKNALEQQGLQVEVTPEQGDLDTNFTFDASGTPSADALTFTWDFDDGTTANGTIVDHTFPWTNNLYEVRVTATAANVSLTRTLEVPVGSGENAAPTVDLHADRAWVGHDDPLTLTADASDPDGDEVTIKWLIAKDQSGGGDGHDHDHGSGGHDDGASGYGIPEDTGERGSDVELSFDESGTYRIFARALDPKGASAEQTIDVKVTRTVPKPTFHMIETGTLHAGTAGAGASLLLYDLQQPSQNTFIDSARYSVRLIYPGQGTLSLDWSNATGAADLDLYMRTASGDEVAVLDEVDPTAGSASTTVDLADGTYVIDVVANAGAEIPYELDLDLQLLIPGLTVDTGQDDGHDHEH